MYKSNIAVKTTGLYKTYPVKSSHMTMFRVLKRRLLSNMRKPETFYALHNINVEIMKGEKIGIVGDNGSGKSTLLKVIAGLHRPYKGQIQVNGELTLLAGLGIGMVDELSVEENIYLYGTIYGLDRAQIDEMFDEIIEWAELQSFVQSKLKTLSTGMRSRLAFSTMRHFQTDIYLLDEALTAGDRNFKEKCEAYFRNRKNNDKTFLIASHDMSFIKMFCTKTLRLHKGKQIAFGDTEEVLQMALD